MTRATWACSRADGSRKRCRLPRRRRLAAACAQARSSSERLDLFALLRRAARPAAVNRSATCFEHGAACLRPAVTRVSRCSRVDARASATVAMALAQTIGALARLTNCPGRPRSTPASPRIRVSRQQRRQQYGEAATDQDRDRRVPRSCSVGKSIKSNARRSPPSRLREPTLDAVPLMSNRRRPTRQPDALRGSEHRAAPRRRCRVRTACRRIRYGRRQAALNQSAMPSVSIGGQRQRQAAGQHHRACGRRRTRQHQQEQRADGVDDAFTPDQLLASKTRDTPAA